MNLLTSLCYPEYKQDINFVDPDWITRYGVAGMGKNRMKPPFTMLRMGELYGTKNHELLGFVKSLNYSFPDNSPWNTSSDLSRTQGGVKNPMRVPKIVTVAISYQVVHASVPGIEFDVKNQHTSVTKFFGFSGFEEYSTSNERKTKIQPEISYHG